MDQITFTIFATVCIKKLITRIESETYRRIKIVSFFIQMIQILSKMKRLKYIRQRTKRVVFKKESTQLDF